MLNLFKIIHHVSILCGLKDNLNKLSELSRIIKGDEIRTVEYEVKIGRNDATCHGLFFENERQKRHLSLFPLPKYDSPQKGWEAIVLSPFLTLHSLDNPVTEGSDEFIFGFKAAWVAKSKYETYWYFESKKQRDEMIILIDLLCCLIHEERYFKRLLLVWKMRNKAKYKIINH